MFRKILFIINNICNRNTQIYIDVCVILKKAVIRDEINYCLGAHTIKSKRKQKSIKRVLIFISVGLNYFL